MIIAKYTPLSIHVNQESGELEIFNEDEIKGYILTFEETTELLSLIDNQRSKYLQTERAKLPWFKRMFCTLKPV